MFNLILIRNTDIRKWETIKQAVTTYKTSSMSLFSARVESKTSCFIVSTVYLDLILMAETKYPCVSEAESDFYFISLSRRYC